METVARYRKIVRELIQLYASWKPSHGDIESEAVMDRQNDHYEVIRVGWDGERRIHGAPVHIDIKDGKVWIQYDGTDRPVAEALMEAGIPKEDIVLAFHPKNMRHLTGFAVA